MASHSLQPSHWWSTTKPVAAARIGLTLIKSPKNRAGTLRSAKRSARNGTTEERMPPVAANARVATVGGWWMRTAIPIGTNTSPEIPAAVADPWAPGSRRPRVRFNRM